MSRERFTSFVLLIERISKNIKRIADTEMAPYGLRSSHVMCIMQLAKSDGGLSSTALAEICGVDKAFISRITRELVEKNYIKQEDNPAGTYKTKFVLTEAGEGINKIMIQIVKDRIDHVDSFVSTKKLEIFYDVLSGLDKGVSDLVNKKESN